MRRLERVGAAHLPEISGHGARNDALLRLLGDNEPHVDGIAEKQHPRLPLLLHHGLVSVAGYHAARLQVGHELGEPAVIGEHLPGAGDRAVELGGRLHVKGVAVARDINGDLGSLRGRKQYEQWHQE